MVTISPVQPPPGYPSIEEQKARHLRRLKRAQVERCRTSRALDPDVYVTLFHTTCADGTVVPSWAVVEESRSGDSFGITHFETKAEAVDAAIRMGMKP